MLREEDVFVFQCRLKNDYDNFLLLREQIENVIQPGPDMREGDIYADDIKTLLSLLSFFHRSVDIKRHPDAPTIVSWLNNILTLIWQMLQENQDSFSRAIRREYQELMEAIDEQWFVSSKEHEAALRHFRRRLQIIFDEEYQEMMIAKMQFKAALAQCDHEIKRNAYQLLDEINEFNIRSQGDRATIINVLRRSTDLIMEPFDHIDSYQRYANTVEGKPSRAYQVLGHAMKVFGMGVYACGFFSMIVGVTCYFPSVGVSGSLVAFGMGIMLMGFMSWVKGRDYVEQGKTKGLSEKMSLFANTVRKSIPKTRHHRKGKERVEDDIPLLALSHHRKQ